LVRHFLVALIAMHFVAVGCASAQAPVGGRFAWDGLGQDPNKPLRNAKRIMRLPAKPDSNAARQRVLNSLQPYSAAWWIVHDEIEAEEQRFVNKKIVICRACHRRQVRKIALDLCNLQRPNKPRTTLSVAVLDGR
jgi:hypothetical protein